MNRLRQILLGTVLLLVGVTATEARAQLSQEVVNNIAQKYAPTCCSRHTQEFYGRFATRVRSCCLAHAEEDAQRLANSLRSGTRSSAVNDSSSNGQFAGANYSAVDPVLFGNALNRYRARNKLAPVSYNPSYDRIAIKNNELQRKYNKGRHYKGHYYTERIAQNAAGGPKTVSSLLKTWANSPGHNALLLDSTAREFGFHHEGHFSTLVMPSKKLGFPAGHP